MLNKDYRQGRKDFDPRKDHGPSHKPTHSPQERDNQRGKNDAYYDHARRINQQIRDK